MSGTTITHEDVYQRAVELAAAARTPWPGLSLDDRSRFGKQARTELRTERYEAILDLEADVMDYLHAIRRRRIVRGGWMPVDGGSG